MFFSCVFGCIESNEIHEKNILSSFKKLKVDEESIFYDLIEKEIPIFYKKLDIKEISFKKIPNDYDYFISQNTLSVTTCIGDFFIELFEVADSFNLLPYKKELSNMKSYLKVGNEKVCFDAFFQKALRSLAPYNYNVLQCHELLFNEDKYLTILVSHLYTGTNAHPEARLFLFKENNGRWVYLDMPDAMIQGISDFEYIFNDFNSDGNLDFSLAENIYQGNPMIRVYTIEGTKFRLMNDYYAKINPTNFELDLDNLNWFFKVSKNEK